MKTDVPAPNSSEIPSAQTARIHGAARLGEDFYWGAHAAGLALLVLSVVLIVFARGPRRADALREAAADADAAANNAQTSG